MGALVLVYNESSQSLIGDRSIKELLGDLARVACHGIVKIWLLYDGLNDLD
tara:strand:+ start:494 stop:646 length:153 start_codon:yes stop_codon:yes gene_type:complete